MSQTFQIFSPTGEFINTADSEKNAFKLLGARNKTDRQILIRAGFKVTPSEGVDLSKVTEEKDLTSVTDQVI